MEKNMGTIDRIVRVLLSVIMFGLLMKGIIYGVLAVISVAVSIILLLTSLVGFCPLYRVLGITTCNIKDTEKTD